MKTLKLVVLASILVNMYGCSSLQQSTYTNYNTPYGNVVKATGKAANNAGLANTSYNCPSCAISGGSGGGGRSSGHSNYNSNVTEMGKITNSAVRTLSNEISRNLNNVIRDSIGGSF